MYMTWFYEKKTNYFLINNIQYKYCFIIIEHMSDTVTMYSSYPVYGSFSTCSYEKNFQILTKNSIKQHPFLECVIRFIHIHMKNLNEIKIEHV